MKIVNVVASSDYASDGVLNHAERLTEYLRRAGADAQCEVVEWRSCSLTRGLARMRPAISGADLVLVHASHLAWSRRGLPFGLLRAVATARRSEARVALWVHDPTSSAGPDLRHRAIDVLKQVGLRRAVRRAGAAVVSLHPSVISWATGDVERLVEFCPSPSSVGVAPYQPPDDLFTVAVFGIGVASEEYEAQPLVEIATRVRSMLGPFRLRLLGARPGDAPPVVRQLEEAGVIVDAPGTLAAEDLGMRLAASHVFVHVRGSVSTRRSTISAALACGVPVIGTRGSDTGPPLDDAGVVLVGGLAEIADAVESLAADPVGCAELSLRNLEVVSRYFTWWHAVASVERAFGIGLRR